MIEKLTNWAGNLTFSAARIHVPESVEQVRELAARCGRARALGTRHSFNAIADCPEDLVSLERLDRIVALDPQNRTVTIEGGMRYGPLCRFLTDAGFALHNLASLPHISVAGACATATHGSGDANRCLAAAVSELEIATANGELVTLSRDRGGTDFDGAVVALGALGIVTRMTLDISPAPTMRQEVFENLPVEQAIENFDTIVAGGYSVSLFTDWRSRIFKQVWVKSIAEPGAFEPSAELFGGAPALDHVNPIAQMPPENCTEQMGMAGVWHERLPHFRIDFMASSGEELQSEYLVPRANAREALRAMDRLRDRIGPLVQVSEIRTVAADRFWMSPFYEQACIGVHFTWVKDWPAVGALLPYLEAELGPLNARPHWGKLFTMTPRQVQAQSPTLPEFRDLLRRYDPQGKFRNDFVDTYLFSAN